MNESGARERDMGGWNGARKETCMCNPSIACNQPHHIHTHTHTSLSLVSIYIFLITIMITASNNFSRELSGEDIIITAGVRQRYRERHEW